MNQPPITIALAGNPNCGKTTLFNALTGASQHIGNWPGVTVEKKSGFFNAADKKIEVVDLPGIYSLSLADTAAVDESITCEFILQQQANIFINIVDASHLERHLYLTTQLLEMGVPVILALNMMDMVRARRMQIDVANLARELGCPVVALEAHKKNGINELKHAVMSYDFQRVKPKILPYAMELQQAINKIEAPHAVLLLEANACTLPVSLANEVKAQQIVIQQTLHEDADILLADTRYQYIQSVCQHYVAHTTENKNMDITH